MAALTAAGFVSKVSYTKHEVNEPRILQNQKIQCLRNQSAGYHGLRPRNKVDSIQLQRKGKSSRKVAKKVVGNDNSRPLAVVICGTGMNIVFVCAEMECWSKTGGLGDVLGGLPPALADLGHRVMAIAPRYDQYQDAWDTSCLVELKVGDRVETVRFFHCYKRGVDRVFVDHPMFLEKVWGKTGTKIYGPVTGTDYQDNQLRFSLLCQAALEAPKVLNLNNSKYFSGPYGEDVVFVANDWHTALLPCYLKSMYQPNGMYKNAKVAFCIHNIAYQGRFAFSDFSLLNLPDQFKSSFDFIDGYDKPVEGRKINWLKAGIIESNIAMTVSPHYAKEMVSSVERGVELDYCLESKGCTGIVNGMDGDQWDSSTDKYLVANFDASTVKDGKRLNKEALQAELGLPVNAETPVIIFIGRLEEQKGSDILVEAIPEIVEEDVQIIILGTGKKKFEKQITDLEEKYPDKARGIAKFNAPLAHLMCGGGDLIIVPSRFEPCGLVQLQAMKNGTVPCVASTGGLVDTVTEGVTGFHMGLFNAVCESVDPADVAAVVSTIKRALQVYGTPAFDQMIQNCMAQDLSWKGPAKKWEEVLFNLSVEGSEPVIEVEEIAPLAPAYVTV